MEYILKLFDTDLIKFKIIENLSDPVLEITWINENEKQLFPLGMDVSDMGLALWLKNRTIPKNRAYVNSFLAKCGLNANRPMDVISVCKGLSLNDSYWIVEDGSEGTFEENNLYDNNFSRVLAMIAFTGYGSSIGTSFASCPEFTTNGMLPKCWRRIAGKVYLYKGATSGASNTGNEPYSELYAYEIGTALGMNVVPYRISKWKKQLCSACELFTSKDIAFIPIGRIVKTGGMKAVRAYYEGLGVEYVDALNEMIVFDAVIYNTDRHYGNFGLLVDSKTNKIIAPAPLFDHGNSLFNLAGEENWADERLLREYANTLLPCVYEDYIEEAKKVMDSRLKEKLRNMLTYDLQKSGAYNYSSDRLKLISKMVRERARVILN
ncbi:MAG: XRE family transcriptional regulator [Lachnospiraceae bacterium]|nr:XRE family transcriptional regulator [Lachnospiraceae bacterium]